MRGRLPRFRRSKQEEPDAAAAPGAPEATDPAAAPDDQPTIQFDPADVARAAAAPARPEDWRPPAAPAQPTAEHAPPAATSPEAWAPATGVAGATPPPVPPIAQPPADLDPAAMEVASAPSFRDRGRLRRRLSYLRRVRELGFRDLGGLVFDLHRFQHPGQELVQAKLNALDVVDRELRALERVLRDKPLYVDLREPGIAACPRCAALHGSDARYCPSCGMRLGGPQSIGDFGGGAPVAPQAAQAPPAAAAEAPTEQLPVTPPAEQPTAVATAVTAAAVQPAPEATGPAEPQDAPAKDQGDALAEAAAPPQDAAPEAPAAGDTAVPAGEPAKAHGDPLEERKPDEPAAAQKPGGDDAS